MFAPKSRVAAPHIFQIMKFVKKTLYFCALAVNADLKFLVFDREHIREHILHLAAI